MAARLLRVMKSPIQKTRIAPTKMYMVLMPATVDMPWWGCSERTGMLKEDDKERE